MSGSADSDSLYYGSFTNAFRTMETAKPMFIELQKLVARVRGGLDFGDDAFLMPVAAHSRVLWLQTARWVNFEQNYDEIEQRFTEAHVSPMKFTRVTQFCEQIREHGSILITDAATLGQALDEVAHFALTNGCVTSSMQHDVLRSILLAERWHPEVKGCISDVNEFVQYWNATSTEAINLAYVSDKSEEHEESPRPGDRIFSRDMPITIHHQQKHPYHRYNNSLTSCFEAGDEACSVMCGTVNFLSKPLIVLMRMKRGITQSCATEVDIPVRFIFVYVGPISDELRYTKLARVFAIMMSSNPLFRANLYEAQTVDDVLKSTDLFMTDALVMPITKYANPEALAGMVRQIEAYKREITRPRDVDRPVRETKRPSLAEVAAFGVGPRKLSALDLAIQDGALAQLEATRQPSCRTPVEDVGAKKKTRQFLKDFCPPFIELAHGIRPWFRRMPSDYKDAFSKENIGIVFCSVLYLYFVNLAPAITFGALLNTEVGSSYTISLAILATGVYLIAFTALGGQPLGFIGITGPTFILETSIASVARNVNFPPPHLRFWVAIYCATFGIIIITFNLSALANHIRRSVEETFNAFIAFFFLLKALFTMFRLIPGRLSPGANDAAKLQFSRKAAIAGSTLFLAFIMLQFCLSLAELKRGNYFRRIIRKLLGALNVPLGMLLISAMNQIFFLGVQLPTVDIPPSNEVDAQRWFNVPRFHQLLDYGTASPALIHGVGIAIGLALAIIIFTEGALNCITAMKNKATKHNAFVIDVVFLLIIFPLISGCIGWPFVSGATVRTMGNLAALVKMEHSPAPGMPHRVIGTVEQRVSGILVGLFVGLSVFLGSILRFIPLAALYGMFLYMGVMGLRDLQIFQRCLALMKRRKHWEDWECVRGLPSGHILVFAIIQAVVVSILVALNIISEFTVATYAGIVFPAVVLIYAVLRETAMPKWKWLAIYLHQLDRKYKLNPAPIKAVASLHKIASFPNKESVVSFGSTGPSVTRDAHMKANLDYDVDSCSEYSEHEDGIIRRTWAT